MALNKKSSFPGGLNINNLNGNNNYSALNVRPSTQYSITTAVAS